MFINPVSKTNSKDNILISVNYPLVAMNIIFIITSGVV